MVNLNKILMVVFFGVLLTIALFLKFDSVTGRVFVWKIIFKNILQIPVGGLGLNSFKYNYANWQMQYFSSHPIWSKYHLLADAPSFAFNEMLHFYIELGIISLIVLGLLIYYNFHVLRNNKNKAIKFSALSNFTILFFAMFSYPLHSFWIVFVFINNHLIITALINNYKLVKIFCFLIIITIFIATFFIYSKYKSAKESWIYAQFIPNSEKIDKLKYYKIAFPTLSTNQYFLNDYCNYCLSEKLNDSVINITYLKRNFFNQFERDMLIGQAYFQKHNFDSAKYFFLNANNIIPNRFISLKNLITIASIQKDSVALITFAKKIISMPIKVNSNVVNKIKSEAQNILFR